MSVAASTRPSANRCLLLIDDEPAQRRLVTAIGARAGWWVMGAPDVEAAQALLQSEEGQDVEAILLDRSEEHTSELPVTNAHLVCRLLLEKKKTIYTLTSWNATLD